MPLKPRAAWLLLPPALFLLAFFVHPLAAALGRGLDATAWGWLAGPYVRDRIGGAFVQALASVALTFLFAMPLAWHHHRRSLPFSRWHLALHAAPFVLPVFVVVHGMREIFGTGGWLHTAIGLDLLARIGSLGAVVLAHAYYNYGFAARLLHAALERRPHRLEDAARVLGAGPRAAFLRASLPLLAPSFLSVALLVFLFAFTSFGVVLLLGQGQVSTIETLLYQNLQGVRPRYGHAAVLGIVQLAINATLLGAYVRMANHRTPRDPTRARAPARPRDHAVSWTALALGLLPALAVLVGGFRVRGDWTLDVWRSLLDAGHAMHRFGFDLLAVLDRTLFYAAWSAALSLALALALTYGLQGTGRARRWLESAAALPLGTSSVLIGFGFLIAFGAGDALDLRGTKTGIVLAHTLVSFPFVARTLLPALDGHDTRMDEAAALLGARPLDVLRCVHWPLLKGPAVAAIGLAVAMSLGDFGASLILMRQDTMSLSVWIGAHDEPFQAFAQAQSVALSGLLMLLATVAFVAVERFRGAP